MDGVTGSGDGFGGPAGVFLGVVAGFAEPLAVAGGGWAVVVPGDDVVVVANGRVAVRGSAGVVAYLALLAVISTDSGIFSIPSSLWVIIGSILIRFCAIKRAARTICVGVANSGGNI